MSDTPRTDNYDWSFHMLFAESQKMERELNAANEHIKRLEEAGDYLCAAAAFMGWHDKIETWNKAKEDKP